MIPAAQSCPRCLKTNLASDPQPPKAGKNWKSTSKMIWFFGCPCGKSWIARRDQTEAHFKFLVQIGELRPDGSLVSRHGVQERSHAGSAAVLPLRDSSGAG